MAIQPGNCRLNLLQTEIIHLQIIKDVLCSKPKPPPNPAEPQIKLVWGSFHLSFFRPRFQTCCFSLVVSFPSLASSSSFFFFFFFFFFEYRQHARFVFRFRFQKTGCTFRMSPLLFFLLPCDGSTGTSVVLSVHLSSDFLWGQKRKRQELEKNRTLRLFS